MKAYSMWMFLAGLVLVSLGAGCSRTSAPVQPDLSWSADRTTGLTQSTQGFVPDPSLRTVVERPKYVPGEVMVVLNKDAELSFGVSFFNDWPLEPVRQIRTSWAMVYRLRIKGSLSVEEMVEQLKADPRVRIAEPNYYLYFTDVPYVPNDPMWENPNDGDSDPRTTVWEQWGPAKLGAPVVWNLTKGSPDITVAVIDTGIRRTHQDLINNIWINEDEVKDNGIDDDANGYIDDWWGWNCFENNNNPFDPNGSNYYHGTGCAGVIAGTQDNNKGISGIAPGVRVMAVRADMNDGPTCEATVCEALEYAKNNGADIFSMSFGVLYPTQILEIECDSIWDNGNGPLMLASAGNDNNQNVLAPACYDSVITVGATVPFSYANAPVDEGRIRIGWNGWWWGSTYGPLLNVMGFGEKFYSTYGSGDAEYWDGVHHWFFNGTSCACPTAAGVMALLMSAHPGHDGQWYWDRLEQTADDLDAPGFDIQTGWGRVNAVRAVFGPDRYSDREDKNGFVRISLAGRYMAPDQEPLYDSIHDVEASNPYRDSQDLYKITVSRNASLRIYLDIFTWGENLDIAVYSNPEMTGLLGSSTTVNHANSSFEQIVLPVTAGKDYYLKVYSPALGNSTTYGLTVQYL